MKDSRDKLTYHSLHGRPLRGGCMPVFLLGSMLLLAGVLMMVRVEMPQPLQPAGEGNLFYRKDELLYSQIRQRCPLPMLLPDFVDPARRQEESIDLPLRRELRLLEAPAESPFVSAPDSVVLNPITLLELPPTDEEKAAAQRAADAAIDNALPLLSKPAPKEPATDERKETP